MYIKRLQNLDFFLIALVLGISIFGVVVIGSATHINWPDPPAMYSSQIKWLFIAMAFMLLAASVSLDFFGRFYLIAYGFINLLLVLVFFVGTEGGGAARWLEIGGFTLQPSELAKVIMIFCLAKLISNHLDDINKPQITALILGFTVVPVLFVFKQPSLSVALIIMIILLTQLFAAEISFRYVFAFFAVLLPVVTLIMLDVQRENPIFADKVLQSYHIDRLLAIQNPEEHPDTAYQSVRSVTALGSGQLEGKGLYKGTLNQVSSLPEQHNDFIFTIIGEEFGFIGCVIVLSVLFLIVLRCSIIAYNACDMFGKLIAAGTAGMFAFQTFVHCGVTMAFLPTTGMGLPFLSYGGSALLTNFTAIGLVLNVGMKHKKSFFEG